MTNTAIKEKERSLFHHEGINEQQARDSINVIVQFKAIWMPEPKMGRVDIVILDVVCIQSKDGYYGIKMRDFIEFMPQEVSNG